MSLGHLGRIVAALHEQGDFDRVEVQPSKDLETMTLRVSKGPFVYEESFPVSALLDTPTMLRVVAIRIAAKFRRLGVIP